MDMDLQSSSNQYSNMDSATMAMIQQMQKLQPTTMQPHLPTPYPTASIEASSSSSPSSYSYSSFEGNKQASIEAMREMIFRIAAMQPVHIDPESVKPPKRRNVRISKDPQSVAARHRRERISERIRILQRLVPGGTKMDTASMLDEAIHYVKFLKDQVQSMEQAAVAGAPPPPPVFATAGVSYQCLADMYQQICEDHHSPLQHYSTR